MAFPAMNAIHDPTLGLELVDGRSEGAEATRYVWLGLDVLDPDRRDQVERLRRGGEEVSSHCLRRTNNYIPRCWITPVEVWVEHMPLELVPDGVRSVEVKDPDLELEGGSSRSVIQNMLRGKPLRSIRTYPGDELSNITETYQRVGIIELESLKGTEWNTGEAQRLQEEFFPSDWPLPIALRLIEERIKDARSAHPQVADGMLRSTSQSRRWAQARLQAEHVLLDTRTKHEWTYTYSPIARNLLDQLEMTHRDQGFETLMAQGQLEMAKAFANAQQGNGAFDINALAAAIATAIVGAQSANKTVEQVKDEVADELKCDGCGKGFDTAQGLSMHKTRYCENKTE